MWVRQSHEGVVAGCDGCYLSLYQGYVFTYREFVLSVRNWFFAPI